MVMQLAQTDDGGARSGSVANKLAEHLREAIIQGNFVVGRSLPSEREMMTQFKVSRTTVREALRSLGAEGLVEVRRGRNGGSYVANQTSKSLSKSLDLFIQGQNIRFLDLVVARLAIEPAAAAHAALSRTEEQVEVLRLCCVECQEQRENIDGFVAANQHWHEAVAEASNNPLFVAFLKSIALAFHAATDLEVFDLVARKAVVGVHWQIFEAIHRQDADAARRRMERHLSAYSHVLSTVDLEAPQRETANT